MKILYFILIIILLAACTQTSQKTEIKDSNDEVVHEDSTDGDENLLLLSDLNEMNSNDLMILRNELYARHGYAFRDTDLLDYFMQREWYEPLYDNVDSLMTEADIANLDLVLETEHNYELSCYTITDFVDVFPIIDEGEFEIDPLDFTHKSIWINNKMLDQFLNIMIEEYMPNCYNYNISAIAQVDLGTPNFYGVITHQTICPTPAVYDEYVFYVINHLGNLRGAYELAYIRGDSEDFYHASVVFEDHKFKKTVKRTWVEGFDEVGGPYTYEEKDIYEIVFDTVNVEITEKKLQNIKQPIN